MIAYKQENQTKLKSSSSKENRGLLQLKEDLISVKVLIEIYIMKSTMNTQK